MCDFCDALSTSTFKEKEIIWNVRSTFADDNIVDMLDVDYSGDYLEDYAAFKLYGHNRDGNIFVGVEYRQEISNRIQSKEKVVISPFSETIQFNFCPICGKQISNNVKEFKDYYHNQIHIEDNK